jgi:hypothetical protein
MADASVRDGTLCLPLTNVTTRQLADVVMAYLALTQRRAVTSAASVGYVAFTQTVPAQVSDPPDRLVFVKELNMTALQGWIVIGLLVLIMLGIVGIGIELKALPSLWRAAAGAIQPP